MTRRIVMSPDLTLERELAAEYQVTCVAGLDEAGRGALAGPVYAAAVVLPLTNAKILEILTGVTDSKLLSATKREQLFSQIVAHASAYGIGSASAQVIDTDGIMAATRQAMLSAVGAIRLLSEALLIDGRIHLPQLNLPQRAIVRGDQQSLSIAAASILAKVSRDRYMIELDEQFPDYEFARHKGYGTASHLASLERLGPCPEHRLSFAPLRQTLL